MRLLIISSFTLLFTSFASAQNATVNATIAGLEAQEPTCVITCAEQTIPQTGCGFDDFKCLCKAEDKLNAILGPCLAVNSTCTAAEIQSTFLPDPPTRAVSGSCDMTER
jgi:hypothetical protein